MPIGGNIFNQEMFWVGDWIGRRAMISPHIEAVYDCGCDTRFSYNNLNNRANKIANYLLEKGISRGNAISIISRNRIEILDLFFACGKIGAILAPISYRLKNTEIENLLGRIKPKALFYEDEFSDISNGIYLPDSISLKIEFSDGVLSQYSRIQEIASDKESNIPLSPDDTFLYIHTGGTTSTPKICEISHRQMIWNSVEMASVSSGIIGTGTELATLPFFHIGGLNIIIPYFHFGGSIIITRTFDEEETLNLIEKEGVDVFPAVSAMLYKISIHPKFASTSFKSLKGIFTGGSSCPKDIMEPFYEKGIPVIQSYGLTEAGPSNFMFFPLHKNLSDIKSKSETVGHPMFHCDYKIVSSETGDPLPKNETGILKLRSPHTFSGYLDDPEKNQKIIDEEGWLDTGDLAMEDNDGFVRIMGRADNMFISGGENVSPEEIETVLQDHPTVSAALCAGVYDKQWGEIPVAEVIIEQHHTATEEELIEFCKEKLANYKVPKRIIFVDQMPLTGAGKPDRKSIIKRFSE